MHSVGLALAWDFWRRARWTMLYCLAGPLAIMLFTRVMMWIGPREPLGSREFHVVAQVIFSMVLGMEVILFTVYLGQIQGDGKGRRGGFRAALLTLPLRTSVLVAWELLFGLATMIFMCFLVAVIFYCLFGVWFPLLGPALLLAAVYAVMQAIVWAGVDFILLRVTALGAALWFTFHWFDAHYLKTIRSNVGWGGNPVADAPWLLGAIAVAFLVAWAGVARDRRGDAQGLPRLKRLGWVGLGFLPQRRRSFRSPAAAQFWFEWCQNGWYLPALSAFSALIPLVIFGMDPRDVGDVLGTSYVVSFVVPLLGGLVLGAQLGRCNHDGLRSDGELDLFRGTRPLDDRGLAYSVLKTSALSLAIGLAIGILINLTFVAGYTICGMGPQVERLWSNSIGASPLGFWLIPLRYLLCLLGAWLLMNLALLPMLSGHAYFFVSGGVLLFFLFMAYSVVRSVIHEATEVRALENLILLGLGSGFLLLTIRAFGKARRRGLIGLGVIGLGVGLDLVILAGVFWFLNPPDWVGRVWVSGLFALTAAPLALAPLAMAWNRHR